MSDKFDQLLARFKQLAHDGGQEFIFGIVQRFCERHNITGIEGLSGLLNYVRLLCREGETNSNDENRAACKSLCEIAYALWALEELNRLDLADVLAPEMKVGCDFGVTGGYKNDEANYFRNIELQLHVALRMIESNLNFGTGGDGEPDYILQEPNVVVEVKAPASNKGLFQCILKAVKQIEKSGRPGIIVIALDHMVRRDKMLANGQLPDLILDIIRSALPASNEALTIGVIAESVEWRTEGISAAVVQAIQLTNKNTSANEALIKRIWQALSNEDISEKQIETGISDHPFPYDQYSFDELNPTEHGGRFYDETFDD